MKAASYVKNWRKAFHGEEIASSKASDNEIECFRNRNMSRDEVNEKDQTAHVGHSRPDNKVYSQCKGSH